MEDTEFLVNDILFLVKVQRVTSKNERDKAGLGSKKHGEGDS